MSDPHNKENEKSSLIDFQIVGTLFGDSETWSAADNKENFYRMLNVSEVNVGYQKSWSHVVEQSQESQDSQQPQDRRQSWTAQEMQDQNLTYVTCMSESLFTVSQQKYHQ